MILQTYGEVKRGGGGYRMRERIQTDRDEL